MGSRFIGDWSVRIILLIGLLAAFTSLNATIVALSRRIYALARDRFVPELLSRIHARFGTPHISLALVFLLIVATIFFGNIEWAAKMAGFSYLLALSLMHLVYIFYRIKFKEIEKPFKLPLFPLIPILGLLLNIAILAQFDLSNFVIGGTWVALGLAVYLLLRWYQKGFEKLKLEIHRIWLKITRREEKM